MTNSLIIILLYVLHLSSLFVEREKTTYNDVLMTQLNYVLELSLLTLFCLMAYWQLFAHRVRLVDMLNTISSSWLELPFREHSQIKTKLHFQVNYVLVSVFALVFIVQGTVTFLSPGEWSKIVAVILSFDLMQLMQFSVLMMISVYALLATSVLQNIREHLEHMESSEADDRVGALKRLSRCYGKMFEVSCGMNESFGLVMVMTAVQGFQAAVSEALLCYHGAEVARAFAAYDLINCGIWCGWQLLKFFLLARAGQSLKVESQKVGQALYKVAVDEDDIHLLAQVQRFSNQINNQRISLTAGGYFAVDATLMYRVISGASMYFIILIQFDSLNNTKC